MYNRFDYIASEQEFLELQETLGLVDLDKAQLSPRCNIPPTTQIDIVRAVDDSNKLSIARWGLIPSWHKPGEKPLPLFNARSETAATKPSFRTAFKKHRCIIPASGFYEWKTVGKEKFPYFIRMKTGLMPFAGLWERWESTDGPVKSAAILTTSSNMLVGALHDRMPCILSPAQFSQWLDPKEQTADGLVPLLQPFAPERMEMWPVDHRVNSVKGGNDAGLIERVGGTRGEQ